MIDKLKQSAGFVLGIALGVGGSQATHKQDIYVDGKKADLKATVFEDACGSDGTDPSKIDVYTTIKPADSDQTIIRKIRKDKLDK